VEFASLRPVVRELWAPLGLNRRRLGHARSHILSAVYNLGFVLMQSAVSLASAIICEPVGGGCMSNVVARVGAILSDVLIEIRKNLVGTVGKALAALIIASAALLWHPIWEKVLNPAWLWTHDYFYPEKILTADEALRAAKWAGVKAIAALPFRNKSDPNDYVLVWAEPSQSDNEDLARPGTLGYGGAEAVLLVGRNGNFEPIRTKVPAMPGHVPSEAISAPDYQAKEGSLIDRDGDGVKEIFAISDQDAMTSAQHNYNLTLYDTGSRAAEQMVATMDRNGAIRSSYAGTNEGLRSWFLQRFDEYLEAMHKSGCSRAATGELTCTKEDEETEDLADEPINKLYAFQGGLIDDWVLANGVDFTRGALQLKFRPVPADIDLADQACEVDVGD
jgi:hypothetical protein